MLNPVPAAPASQQPPAPIGFLLVTLVTLFVSLQVNIYNASFCCRCCILQDTHLLQILLLSCPKVVFSTPGRYIIYIMWRFIPLTTFDLSIMFWSYHVSCHSQPTRMNQMTMIREVSLIYQLMKLIGCRQCQWMPSHWTVKVKGSSPVSNLDNTHLLLPKKSKSTYHWCLLMFPYVKFYTKDYWGTSH